LKKLKHQELLPAKKSNSIESTGISLIVIRANIRFENLQITTDWIANSTSTILIEVHELQTRKAAFKDLNVDIYGNFFRTIDPLNLEVTNVEFNLQYVPSGFTLQIQ
jgi:hypothetical protein